VSSALHFNQSNQLLLPKRNGTHTKKKNLLAPKHKLKLKVSEGHSYHIHSVSASSDGLNFISGDEVSINLWDLEDTADSYNVINIAPTKIDEILEMITYCECHPSDSSIFLYTSSKGYFNVCDLRISSNQKSFSTKFDCTDDEINRGYFSEIVKSVSSASF